MGLKRVRKQLENIGETTARTRRAWFSMIEQLSLTGLLYFIYKSTSDYIFMILFAISVLLIGLEFAYRFSFVILEFKVYKTGGLKDKIRLSLFFIIYGILIFAFWDILTKISANYSGIK